MDIKKLINQEVEHKKHGKGIITDVKITTGGNDVLIVQFGDIKKVQEYRLAREEDILQLEKDVFLNKLKNHRGGHRTHGIDMARQRPDYHLYDPLLTNKWNLDLSERNTKIIKNTALGFLPVDVFGIVLFASTNLRIKSNVTQNLNGF